MNCPKCTNNDGFISTENNLWFKDNDIRIGSGRTYKDYQYVIFECNHIGCGQLIKVWCKLSIKFKKIELTFGNEKLLISASWIIK